MLLTAIALLALEPAVRFPEPARLSIGMLVARRNLELAWLEWYARKPPMIREKPHLKQLAALKRDYARRLEEEALRRLAKRR